jgi:hypothetical protein
MAGKEEIFKTIILFLFFLFGCSHKYVNAERESLDGKVVASWEELDCKIVEQDEQDFSLGFEIRDIAVISGSAKLVEPYKRSSREKKDVWNPLGMLVGLGGCIGGCYYGLHDNISWCGEFDEDRFDRGCVISFTSCVAGLGMIFIGNAHKRKIAKAIPAFIKEDTVCTGGESLSIQKVKISINRLDFVKTYWTDGDGNIGLQFDEFNPEPAGADSVLNLIIQYEEMVDTVMVRRL